MWLPKTEKEINDIVKSGSLEETTIFDAKKELSSNNQEIAKDIAAMANDGGVIIYGIGEDENKRLTVSNPILIDGQAERIDAIVRSSIAEPPQVYIKSIPTENDTSCGYLVIYIPPSERAPHMVIVKGENRYYGRSAKGNVLLNEGEVARLYNRREKLTIDREKLLNDEINASPLGPNPNFAYLYLIAKPIFYNEQFLDPILKSDKQPEVVFNELIAKVYDGKIFKTNSFNPDFHQISNWKRRVDGYLGQIGLSTSCVEKDPTSTLNIQIDFNGSVHLFCGKVAESRNKRKGIYSIIIAGLTCRFLYLVSNLSQYVGYIGMVDFGIAITGLKGGQAYTKNFMIEDMMTPYDEDTYRKTGRFSVLDLKENLQKYSEDLVMPLISAISQNRINPFN